MYIAAVEVRKSSINGRGVFALSNIPEGQIVWQFTEGHDQTITVTEFEALNRKTKDEMERVGYLSPYSNMWVYPPPDDPARYTNHSRQNNTSVVFDNEISPEPYFVANRDIKKGEEITNNYYQFDLNIQKQKPTWT